MAIRTPIQTQPRTPESWPRQGDWTITDWERLPSDDGWRYELIRGTLYMSPSPLTVHQRALRVLVVQLSLYSEEHALGEVFFAPFDVLLPLRATVVEPDLVFVASDQSDIIGRRGVKGVPALLVEVLSPSTKWVDLSAKRSAFAESGVPEYWIVDLRRKTITVHTRESVKSDDSDQGRLVEGGEYATAYEYGSGESLISHVVRGFTLLVDDVIPKT